MKTNRTIWAVPAIIVGVAVMLVSCDQRGEQTPIDTNADVVNFSSGAQETRTNYSGEVIDGKERVEWLTSDVVTIWSDKADDHTASKKNYADYQAGTAVNSGYTSTAPLTIVSGGSSLRWNSTDNEYQFWGAYPKKNVTVAMSGDKANVENPSFTATIPGTQAISAHNYTTGEGESATTTVKYEPSMDYAYMASYKKTPKTEEKVTLPFDMAFTAFEFTVKSKDSEFELESFTLTSGRKEGVESFPVTGGFVASCTSGTWSYAAGTTTSNNVTITLPAGTKVSDTKEVTFTVFALPMEMKNLTASFKIKGEDNPKNLDLKTGGEYRTFAACKKHKIGVLAIPTGWKFKVITIELEAMDWEEIAKSTDEYAQATQFEVIGDYVELREDEAPELKQSWYVTKNQPFTVTYKVFLPDGGSWSIVPAGDVDAFTIEGATSGSIAAGANGTRVTLTITPTGDAGKTLYFKTYVKNSAGVEYSIDSETQLFDVAVDNGHPNIMRGFHKFEIKNN